MNRNLVAGGVLTLAAILTISMVVRSRYEMRVFGQTVSRLDHWTGKLTVCSNAKHDGPWGLFYSLDCESWPKARSKSGNTAADNRAVENLSTENLVVENE